MFPDYRVVLPPLQLPCSLGGILAGRVEVTCFSGAHELGREGWGGSGGESDALWLKNFDAKGRDRTAKRPTLGDIQLPNQKGHISYKQHTSAERLTCYEGYEGQQTRTFMGIVLPFARARRGKVARNMKGGKGMER